MIKIGYKGSACANLYPKLIIIIGNDNQKKIPIQSLSEYKGSPGYNPNKDIKPIRLYMIMAINIIFLDFI